ncbi:unnamed protein product [Gongylonema pulchrum]|uniref:Transposase n=1 Tax=Gongylonema pulchrum TaxID=637853 RepID=A0A183EYW8_9BILA|nr:unnamed protein product [Gongylonema pulchrum]
MYSDGIFIIKHQVVRKFFYKSGTNFLEDNRKKAIMARFEAANVQSRIGIVHPVGLDQQHYRIYPTLQTGCL